MELKRLAGRWPPWGSVFWKAFVLSFVLQTVAGAQASSAPTPDREGGMLRPQQLNGRWGYVDSTGKFLIPPQFDSAGTFSEGLAPVELDRRFGYISIDGQFVVRPKYFRAGPFKDGFAWVVVRKPWTPLGTGEYGVALYGEVTYIDHSGHEILRPFSAEHVSNFSEGLAAVRPGKISGGCSEKVGYLNTRGEWSIKPQFDEAYDFSDELAAVNRGGKCQMGGKWGYIDKGGALVVPFQYDYAGQFNSGYACVKEGEQWKLINKAGNGTFVDKSKCLQ
jgi:hypothetical protein